MRKYQPHRDRLREQPDRRSDQRPLGEAEMIVDQQVDIGNVRRQRDLVEEDSDEDGDVDGQHQSPGVFPPTQIHRAPNIPWASEAQRAWGSTNRF